MRLVRYILKSITLLNLVLVAVVALLAAYVLFPTLNMKATYKPPVVKATPAAEEERPATGQSPALSDYLVVAEQNVFNPERKIPPETKDEKTLTRPEIFLYGTLVADDVRLAYIEDRKSPQSSPGRGKRQSVVKQGDTVSGFVLKSVEPDRIVLVRGQEEIIVLLDDAKKPREAVASLPRTGTLPGMPGGTTPGTAGRTFPAGPGGTPAGTLGGTAPGTAAAAMSGIGSQAPASAAGSVPMRQPSRPGRTYPTAIPRTTTPQQ